MVSTTDEVVNEVAPVEAQQPTEIKTISEEDFEKAQKLFQSGKKNLFLNKYDESVNNIGEACKIYAAKYGEMDTQCAEVYFFYGRALLELARIENTVLGNALSGVPEESGPIDDSRYGNPEDVAVEEKNEISEKVIDALCSNEEEMKTETTTTTTKNDEENKTTTTPTETGVEKPCETTTTKPCEEEKEKPTTETTCPPKEEEKPEVKPPTTTTETKPETKPETTTETTTATTEEKKTGEKEEEEEEECDDDEEAEEEAGEEETAEEENKEEAEDISNLQRSWEMFELAKLIYTKNFNEDQLFKNKRTAECLMKLGEISIEQEIYEQAITDITESIRIQEEMACADRDERMLAESYYQLGLARQFNNQFGEANESYQRSINIVQLRIEKLKGKLMSVGEGADAELEKTTINDEIGELEALLPEMTSKLEEVNEQGQQTLNLIKEAKECMESTKSTTTTTTTTTTTSTTTTTNGTCPTNGDVKDITSMVKSKRKIDSVEESSSTVKKTRLSEGGASDECKEKECTKCPADENKENKTTSEEEPMKVEESVSKEQNGTTPAAVEEQPAAANPEPIETA